MVGSTSARLSVRSGVSGRRRERRSRGTLNERRRGPGQVLDLDQTNRRGTAYGSRRAGGAEVPGSMEVPEGLDGYSPDDPEHFGISVMALIGTADSEKVDSFDIVVCTPSWVSEHFGDARLDGLVWEPRGVRFGNRFVFMQRWDYSALQRAVTNLCAYWEAGDWGTLANRLGRYIPWEFAYKYDAFIDNTASKRPPFPPREEP